MLSSDSTQGIYAPLSQVMTDSDSEEEIHNSIKHHRLQQLGGSTRNLSDNSGQLNSHQQSYIEYQLKEQQHWDRNQYQKQLQQRRDRLEHQQQLKFHQNNHLLKSELQKDQHYLQQLPTIPSTYTTNMQNTFRSVIMSDSGANGDTVHHGSNFSSFNSDYDDRPQTDADNVAILGRNEIKDLEPMSTARRYCFVASLLVCVITVVAFLSVPCSDVGTCPAELDRVMTHNWLNNYTKIELKAIINVVDGIRSLEKNLIFLYRGDAFFPEFERINSKRNGIISLIGSSGAVAWFDEMVDEPVTIDCTLLDVDHNGTPDCLVIDEYGELGAINPISGQWHWKFKEKSEHKIDALDFPVILPDLDGDGVLDILLATSGSLEQRKKNFIRRGGGDLKNDSNSHWYGGRNFLRIISGRVGKSIGEGYKIHDCDSLRKFQLEKNHLITYNCVCNNTEVQRSKALAELFSLITNKSIGQKLTPVAKISQHRHYGQRKETEAQRNIYSLSGRELIVENRGKCPNDCNVSFILSETKKGKVNVLRNFTNTRMYGMVPAQWHFKNGKSKLSGFVMKFWMWSNNNSIDNLRQQNQESVNQKKNFDAPENIGHVKRSMADITKQKISSSILLENYKMQFITEMVFLVIFNGADTKIENSSQSNIIQFCRHERNEAICQPDLNNQENSLLIADLDQDGEQELVSYYSTFFNKEDERKAWKLVTFVQLLRLESELSGFYQRVKPNK